MLKLILQAVLLAGGIALGISKLDSGAMQHIKDAVRELASGVGLGQYPPARPEPSTIPIGGAAKESAAPEQRRAEQNPIPPKAFYHAPSQECHWEKIIDPEDGSVRCSVPDRRQVARQR